MELPLIILCWGVMAVVGQLGFVHGVPVPGKSDDVAQIEPNLAANIITAMNDVRRNVGASNMALLMWETDLELAAKQCDVNPSGFGVITVPGTLSVDNVTLVSDDIQSACPNLNCSNYRQLVFYNATRVGCHETKCGDQAEIRCFFNKRLDSDVPPFKSGSACSDCPSHLSVCQHSLCIAPEIIQNTETTSEPIETTTETPTEITTQPTEITTQPIETTTQPTDTTTETPTEITTQSIETTTETTTQPTETTTETPPEITTQPTEITTQPIETTTETPPEITTQPTEITTQPIETTTQPTETTTETPPEITTQPTEITTQPIETTTQPTETTTQPTETTSQPTETTTPVITTGPEEAIAIANSINVSLVPLKSVLKHKLSVKQVLTNVMVTSLNQYCCKFNGPCCLRDSDKDNLQIENCEKFPIIDEDGVHFVGGGPRNGTVNGDSAALYGIYVIVKGDNPLCDHVNGEANENKRQKRATLDDTLVTVEFLEQLFYDSKILAEITYTLRDWDITASLTQTSEEIDTASGAVIPIWGWAAIATAIVVMAAFCVIIGILFNLKKSEVHVYEHAHSSRTASIMTSPMTSPIDTIGRAIRKSYQQGSVERLVNTPHRKPYYLNGTYR